MNCRDFPENYQDKERFSETGTWKPAGKRGLFFLSPENFMMRVPVVGSTLMSEQRARFNVPTPRQGYQGVPARTGPAIPATAATLLNQDVNVTDLFNQDHQALIQ